MFLFTTMYLAVPAVNLKEACCTLCTMISVNYFVIFLIWSCHRFNVIYDNEYHTYSRLCFHLFQQSKECLIKLMCHTATTASVPGNHIHLASQPATPWRHYCCMLWKICSDEILTLLEWFMKPLHCTLKWSENKGLWLACRQQKPGVANAPSASLWDAVMKMSY